MKRVLIFIHDGFADYELSYASSFMHMSNEVEMVFMSPGKKEVISKGGIKFEATKVLDDSIVAEDYDALMLVGGRYWSYNNFENFDLAELVGDFIRQKKVVAAICDASTYLAFNGFLNYNYHTGNGKEYFMTTCPMYDGMRKYLEQQCVVDLPFITANGTAGIEFGYFFCKALDISTEDARKDFFAYHLKKLHGDTSI